MQSSTRISNQRLSAQSAGATLRQSSADAKYKPNFRSASIRAICGSITQAIVSRCKVLAKFPISVHPRNLREHPFDNRQPMQSISQISDQRQSVQSAGASLRQSSADAKYKPNFRSAHVRAICGSIPSTIVSRCKVLPKFPISACPRNLREQHSGSCQPMQSISQISDQRLSAQSAGASLRQSSADAKYNPNFRSASIRAICGSTTQAIVSRCKV